MSLKFNQVTMDPADYDALIARIHPPAPPTLQVMARDDLIRAQTAKVAQMEQELVMARNDLITERVITADHRQAVAGLQENLADHRNALGVEREANADLRKDLNNARADFAWNTKQLEIERTANANICKDLEQVKLSLHAVLKARETKFTNLSAAFTKLSAQATDAANKAEKDLTTLRDELRYSNGDIAYLQQRLTEAQAQLAHSHNVAEDLRQQLGASQRYIARFCAFDSSQCATVKRYSVMNPGRNLIDPRQDYVLASDFENVVGCAKEEAVPTPVKDYYGYAPGVGTSQDVEKAVNSKGPVGGGFKT